MLDGVYHFGLLYSVFTWTFFFGVLRSKCDFLGFFWCQIIVSIVVIVVPVEIYIIICILLISVLWCKKKSFSTWPNRTTEQKQMWMGQMTKPYKESDECLKKKERENNQSDLYAICTQCKRTSIEPYRMHSADTLVQRQKETHR